MTLFITLPLLHNRPDQITEIDPIYDQKHRTGKKAHLYALNLENWFNYLTEFTSL